MPAHGASRDSQRAVANRSTRSIARRVEFLTDYQDARVREALRATSSSRCARPKRAAAGHTGADRSRRALLLQADGLQGRVRSRAPVHRDRFREAQVAEQFEGDYKLHFHLAPPLLEQARCKAPASRARATYGPWMMQRVPRAGEAAPAARHRARRVRHDRRAQDGARADRRLRSAGRRMPPG